MAAFRVRGNGRKVQQRLLARRVDKNESWDECKRVLVNEGDSSATAMAEETETFRESEKKKASGKKETETLVQIDKLSSL